MTDNELELNYCRVDPCNLFYFYSLFLLASKTHTHTDLCTQRNTHSLKAHQPLHTERLPQGNQQTKEIYKPETMAGIKI